MKLRQSYVRVAKRAAIKAGRYAHAKPFKRMRRELKKLRTRLGRVIRDLRRKTPQLDLALADLLTLCERNPYDGHTLAQAISTIEQTTGVSVTDAYVDKGYRGHYYAGEATVHIAGTSTRTLSRDQKKRRMRRKKRRMRRTAVEPKTGHLKSDNRLRRCFLKGLTGDAINVVLAAAGSN